MHGNRMIDLDYEDRGIKGETVYCVDCGEPFSEFDLGDTIKHVGNEILCNECAAEREDDDEVD